MRTILGGSLAALLCLGAGLLADDKKDEKIDAKNLVGKWKPKDAEKEGDPNVIEFGKDGKLIITSRSDDKFKVEGTYKVDGKKVTWTRNVGGKEKAHTLTISKLTDAELVLIDEDGKEAPLTRIKDK